MQKERSEQVLETCNKIFDGVETESLSGNSILLLVKRIARLSNDEEAILWLSYETGGYPREKDGHIIKEAWDIGAKHGRKYISKGSSCIFTELIAELEEGVDACQKALNCFSTSGASFNGDKALLATKQFTLEVNNSAVDFVKATQEKARKKSILLGEYYKYAVNKQIEIQFGNITKTIFDSYQERVNKHISCLNVDIYGKLKAINNAMERNNIESNSQALLTCRKLFIEFTNELFENVLPNYQKDTFKTKSGKELKISGDCTKNKLSAVIETMASVTLNNSLIGSNIIYLIDWLDDITTVQSKGVHNDIDRDTAEQCVIQTYIALGNVLELYSLFSKQKSVANIKNNLESD